MSPGERVLGGVHGSFPRVSGDEPTPTSPQRGPLTFSPRERG